MKFKGAQWKHNYNVKQLRDEDRQIQSGGQMSIFNMNLSTYEPNSMILRKHWSNSTKGIADAPSMKTLNWDCISKKKQIWNLCSNAGIVGWDFMACNFMQDISLLSDYNGHLVALNSVNFQLTIDISQKSEICWILQVTQRCGSLNCCRLQSCRVTWIH